MKVLFQAKPDERTGPVTIRQFPSETGDWVNDFGLSPNGGSDIAVWQTNRTKYFVSDLAEHANSGTVAIQGFCKVGFSRPGNLPDTPGKIDWASHPAGDAIPVAVVDELDPPPSVQATVQLDCVQVSWTPRMGQTTEFTAPGVMAVILPPPVIVQQPQPATVPAGVNVTFRVVAIGQETLSYQWLKDGQPLANGGRISGAISSELTVAQVQATDSSGYSVRVSDTAGTTTSLAALLQVGPVIPVNNGLVAYYPLDGDANDASGNQLNGVGNGISYVSGVKGQASYFNGDRGNVSIADSPELDISGAITLSAWIKMEEGGTCFPRIINKKAYQIWTEGTGATRRIGFFVWCSSYPASEPVPVGEWIHIAATHDGAMSKLYLNGNLAAQTEESCGIPVNDWPLVLGWNPETGCDSFKGAIDEVRIYNRVLSTNEVAILYSLGLPQSEVLTNGLHAYYPLDGNGQDASGNERHGTASAVSWEPGVRGNAGFFNGTTSEVDIGNIGPIDDISVSLWFKKGLAVGYPPLPIWSNEADLFGTQSGDPACHFLKFGFHSTWKDNIFLTFGENNCASGWNYRSFYTDDQITDSAWHHLVVVRQGSAGFVFLDGILRTLYNHEPRNNPAGTITTGQTTKIGTVGGVNDIHFLGQIDEVRIYRRAISADEVALLYSEIASTNLPFLVPISSLSNSVTQFQTAFSQNITVRNDGGGTMGYSLTVDMPWLSVSPVSGSSSGETDFVAVNYATAGLAPGEHVGHLTVNAPSAANSPQTVAVHLRVINPISLEEALDTPGWAWTTGGGAIWAGQASISHDGVDAVRSGVIGDGQESWIETTLTGPGSLSFRWKTSSNQGFDWLRYYLDGRSLEGISGDWDWEQKTFRIPFGSHTFRWSYVKDASFSALDDAAWLDEVSFMPDTGLAIAATPQPQTNYVGMTAFFSVTARGELPIDYQWRYQNGSPTYVLLGETNATLIVTNLILANAGYYFVTVSNVAGVTNIGADLTVLLVPPFKVQSMNGSLEVTNGMLRFHLTTPPGADAVIIEASSNLADWLPIYTNHTPAMEFNFADRSACNHLWRFYRATVR